MKIVYRFKPALYQPTPYSGPLPGSGRDLEVSPLDRTEEDALQWLKGILPNAQKHLRRHGMAFDRDLFEAWKQYDQGEKDAKDGKIAANPHERPAQGAYRGNWYECIDCAARGRTAGSPIRLEWNSGPGIMTGVSRDYISPQYNPKKQKDDLVNKTLTVFIGWICPRCERARIKAKIEQREKSVPAKEPLLEEAEPVEEKALA